MRCLYLSVFFVCFLINLACANENEQFRLPGTSIPVNYDLKLVTNVHNGTRRFDGVVKIGVQVTVVTQTLTLHLRDLIIDEKIKIFDDENIDIFDSESTEPEKHFLHLNTLRPLAEAENLTVEIVYHGNVQTTMAGFYLSTYKVDGITR